MRAEDVRAALAPLVGACVVAGLIGPLLFDTLGDRMGRRSAMIAGGLMIGTVVCGYCTSASLARCIAGIGMLVGSMRLFVTVTLP